MTTLKNKHRRALLRSTLGLSVLGISLPSTWQKPIVHAVLLPVHAQTSAGSLVLTPTPASGSNVALTSPISLNVAIQPNPGAGESVEFSVLCNGSPANSGTFSVLTNANGEAVLQNATGQGEGCVAGNTLTIIARYASMSESAEWIMT